MAMADDGLLVNFSIGDGIIKPEAKFKGGTWRDRLSAKKLARRRAQNSHPSKAAGGDDEQKPKNANNAPLGSQNKVDTEGGRPTKRQRTDGGEFRPTASTGERTQGGQQVSSSGGAGGGRGPHRPKQVISSLFTSNPTPRTVGENEKLEGADEDVKVQPSNAPIDGMEDFTALGLTSTLAAHLLTKMELKAPTAIQKASIPQLVKDDSDAFIQAETGSGKTLAYLLPLVQRIMGLKDSKFGESGTAAKSINRDSGLFAIVLAPTRELCKQISVVLENLLRSALWIVAGTVIGGEKKKSEKARLRKGLNILVATPGRLADHLDNTKVLDVSSVRWLVLDEGDRLMDMGFEEEIQGIVKKLDARQRPSSSVTGLPSRRITVLCSATLKLNVQRLGEISLKDAVHIKADPADEPEKPKDTNEDRSNTFVPAQLKQSYVVTAAKLRLVTLTALMKRTFARKGSVMKAIIFVSCADSVDFHFEVFRRQINQEENKESDKESDSEEKQEGENEKEETSEDNEINPEDIFDFEV